MIALLSRESWDDVCGRQGRLEKSGKKTNTKENSLLGKLKFKPVNLGNLKFKVIKNSNFYVFIKRKGYLGSSYGLQGERVGGTRLKVWSMS